MANLIDSSHHFWPKNSTFGNSREAVLVTPFIGFYNQLWENFSTILLLLCSLSYLSFSLLLDLLGVFSRLSLLQ